MSVRAYDRDPLGRFALSGGDPAARSRTIRWRQRVREAQAHQAARDLLEYWPIWNRRPRWDTVTVRYGRSA